ncbi:MAG: helix-turn-helix transcriptional regulator [Deltaproteobacteria bacterium]|nr:helix-turn-helix transcriptional regulator [Deltaproteobacteria bacterium]MBW2444368.1 helix-turn-helix transcriptional regulator [Deltaproteobacteria bacterium]
MSVLFPGLSDSLHVRLFSAGYLELGKWWTQTDHIRNMWRLCRTDEDGASLEWASGQFQLPAGCFALIPPGLDFTAHLERRVHELYVHFEVIGWGPAMIHDLFPEPITLPEDDLRDQLASQLREELANSDHLGPALASRVKSLVHLTLASMETALPEDKATLLRRVTDGQAELLDVLRYIDRNLDKPLDNASLARIAHASESCFIRRFKETVGQTPGRYIQDRRVDRAANLLISTDDSIDEIARRCGFATRYYLSRVFSRRIGRPPARYRKDRPVSKVAQRRVQ